MEQEELELLENENNNDYENNTIYQYYKDISKYKVLSKEDEINLARRIKNDDKKARDIFINSNLKLVVAIAKEIHSKFIGLNLEDVIQDGNIGLMYAVDHFDPDKGFRFSTYAKPCIVSYIKKGIMENGRTIRLPKNVIPEITYLNKVIHSFELKNGRTPSLEEIYNLTEKKFSKEKIQNLRTYNLEALSLDGDFNEDENSHSLFDTIEDTSVENPTEYVDKLFNKEDITKKVAQLNEVERYVIVNRYGLVDGKEMTLTEIGEILNLSHQRVKQIEKNALDKMYLMTNEKK